MSQNTIEIPAVTSPVPVKFFKRNSKRKSSLRKRVSPPPVVSNSKDSLDLSNSDEQVSGANRHTIKKPKTKASLTASPIKPIGNLDTTTRTTYSVESYSMVSDASKEAAKVVDWYDEGLNDISKQRESDKPHPSSIENTYKGISSYGSFIKKSEKSQQRNVGPLKPSNNVRTVTITDYAPDVCKDYKQTGFCGFGDTCKFLHAREDYAAGWKLDREWEIGRHSQDTKQPDDNDLEYQELKDIPFKCVICKNDYENPILTKCGHCFCESCAIKNYKKNPSCVICGRRTDGVFNMAKNLKMKLERKKQGKLQRPQKMR